MDDIIGTPLGPYHLVRLLARGGMSEVYLASREHSEQSYAIKVLQGEDEEHGLRFQREVHTLLTAKHPHIIPTLDAGQQDGVSYYVMPYIEAGSLKERLAAGPLSLDETGAILTQIADALHFLHTRGTIHRDLKPGNLLLGERNHVWLADFGLAKQVGGVNTLTAAGNLMGTPYYMAPELIDQPASTSSDIYALGVVIYEMLTGRVPFQGRTPVSICLKHLREPLPVPSRLNPQLSPALDQVLFRALAKTPSHRFSTPHELAAAYQTALTSPEVSIVPLWLNPATITIVPRPRAPGGMSRQKRTYARLAAAATVLFALGLACLGMIFPRGSSVPAARAVQMISAPAMPTPTVPTPVPTTKPATVFPIFAVSDGQQQHGYGKHHGKHHGHDGGNNE